ncbi:ATP phosphoribosyltransferase regulatory subunit [Mesorhizobium sp. Root554]|uniref:ATP phosphoribosyltransferase regulatory subunit n=1 Tax=unclassified Mesorhizobium TaxID=325217 RepID=UPI0007006890|nr:MULTISPECIES: ATP phosphoribosyltransferase regulatory subunit [unclassified Mesorhizobium]KQZ15715.1 ATP phosphoribosyltransferase regulatory subunit [Mesorhizobium sp. Root1471]KQZ38222.1 ATP phosphoribosyltransferase regulatory subunit [Mesorhizobium sp. Root554]
MTARRPAISDAIEALFAMRGAALVDVPVLQPADPFLDMAGEDLRRRIFLTESETGRSLCLRPEFTIPVCLDHIASQAGTPRRYAYLGEVFRQRRDGPAEFFQAGIEDLGDRDTAKADARSVADAIALLELALPKAGLVTTLGDQAVFEAVLAALGLPRGWRMRLARAFGSRAMLEAALADLANPPRNGQFPPEVAALAVDGDAGALAAHLAEGMEKVGLSASAGRTPADIARRLIEKAQLRSVRLSDEPFAALKAFLAIKVPLDGAAAALAGFAADAGLSLGAALDSFAARAAAIAGHGRNAGAIVYDAAFGRPLDYYTGLVFEISVDGGDRPLAGGGRYDRLLTLLGATAPIPGVGFSVWLDRIEAARESGT